MSANELKFDHRRDWPLRLALMDIPANDSVQPALILRSFCFKKEYMQS